MYRIIILATLFIFPNKLIAQVQIGDIEVGSLKELFNKDDDSFWNEFGMFNKSESEFWITGAPSMLLDVGDEIAIILAFKKDLDVDSIRTTLIKQLNNQFGKYEEKQGPSLMNVSSIEWQKSEEGFTYVFSLSDDKKVGALYLFKR